MDLMAICIATLAIIDGTNLRTKWLDASTGRSWPEQTKAKKSNLNKAFRTRVGYKSVVDVFSKGLATDKRAPSPCGCALCAARAL
jgi:hypothetical protein